MLLKSRFDHTEISRYQHWHHCDSLLLLQQNYDMDQQSTPPSFSEEEKEQMGIYIFSEELRNANPPVEPWFMEMSRLRRMYILWINRQLALCRKSILEQRRPSDEDMENLGKVLHLQGKYVPSLLMSEDCTDFGEHSRSHQGPPIHTIPRLPDSGRTGAVTQANCSFLPKNSEQYLFGCPPFRDRELQAPASSETGCAIRRGPRNTTHVPAKIGLLARRGEESEAGPLRGGRV